MKIKLLSFVTICMLPLSSFAADFIINNVTYTPIYKDAVGIKDVESDASEYIIPETVTNDGVTYNVKRVEEEAFKYTKATKIVLPNSVDSIMYGGLYTCSNLTDLTLPANLKYIDAYGIASAPVLTTVNIPASLKEIPRSCFYACYKLSNVTFNEGLKSIGSGAFYKCAMTSISLPESCDSIARTAFLFCKDITSLKLSSKLKYIGDGAFNGCTGIEHIEFPNSVEYIGDEAFLGCTSLVTAALPASLKTIGSGAFAKTGLTTFTIDEANTNFKVISGVLYNSSKTILYAYPSKGATTYTVEKGCIGLGSGAFWGATIDKVVIPDGMRAFDSYVFCESTLSDINFPKSLVFMGEQALAGTKLVSVVLPENMPYISDGLLAWSKSLTSVTIPSGVLSIANHAFQTCSALASIKCLGSVAPEIEDYYDEEDNPFGYITRSNVSVTIPKGYLDSYKAAGWNALFSSISDVEAAPFAYTSMTPAQDAKVKSFDGVKIVFAQTATIVSKYPKAELRKDNILSGSLISVDDWMAVASSDKLTITIFPADYDGYTSPVALENGSDYYLTIPAGTIKNASGELNEKIILHIIGDDGSGVEAISGVAEPMVIAANGTLNVVLNGQEDCTVELYDLSGRLVKSQSNVNDSITFDVDGVNGIYIVKVANATSKSTFKVEL